MNAKYLLIALAALALQACGTVVKEDPNDISNLPVRKECSLERLYKDMKGEIKADSPDMLFVNALCSGNPQSVVDLFREKKLFWDELPAVDTPYGRFEGLDAIREFAQGFIPKFKADRVVFTPIFQTIGGGRVALEGVFKFVVDGEVEEVPMFVIADLRTPTMELGLSVNLTWEQGLTFNVGL